MQPVQNELVFVGDRSASMTSMGDAPWKGARDWANEQAALALESRIETRLTLVSFANSAERHLDSVDTSDWKTLRDEDVKAWFAPNGCTRLHDTVIEELNLLRTKMKSGCAGVFALFTDGYDNKSEHSLSAMNEAVTDAQEAGVKCFFLGANQDAIASGARYGFASGQCLSTGSDAITSANAFKAMTSACMRTISQPDARAEFTALERLSSAPLAPPPRYDSA